MSGAMAKQAAKDIGEADLVLVGLGEELDLLRMLKKDERYLSIAKNLDEKWLLPYIEKALLDEMGRNDNKRYEDLAKCLDKKNYFIVSLCQDGAITKAGLNPERIVEPCGAYRRLQCVDGCSKELYEVPERILSAVNEYLADQTPECLESLEMPVCPSCGKPLVFNNVEAENYVEEGYLEGWGIYQKWLQGSVNRKLCVLELGVGMKYPTVARWPFEKIVFFNLKSKLYRVHSRLYQTAEEIKERSCGICQKPEEFLKELSNGF